MWSGSKSGNGYQSAFDSAARGPEEHDASEVTKTLLVGVLGGLLSAAGYMIYRRLPDEQKEKLHAQIRSAVQQRITEFRQNFNI
jgi:hypothetical protein